MRYFLVSYTGNTEKQHANGNVFFDHASFPSNKWIKEVAVPSVHKDVLVNTIVVSNIYEFKDKQDYEAFVNKGSEV